VAELQDRLAWLESQRKRDWQEFSIPADHAINEEVSRVERLIDLAEIRGREQEELSRLRVESIARAEADRLAVVAKEAREQAERAGDAERERLQRDKLAAEQRAKDAELAAEEARAQVEVDRIAAANKAQRDQEAAVEAERMRVADIAEGKRKADEARAADKEHRLDIHDEVVKALLQVHEVNPETAENLVEAISNGLIPHVTINY
jgi:membrane protein involved in colicin uptake